MKFTEDDLSRIKMYSWMQYMLNSEDESDPKVKDFYEVLKKMAIDREILSDTIQNMLFLLSGIEEMYTINKNVRKKKDTMRDVIGEKRTDQRWETIGQVFENHYSDPLSSINETKESPIVTFSKIVQSTVEIGSKALKDYKRLDPKDYSLENGEWQVFLSYASEDQVYTLCLFLYMRYNDVNMFVDWIFNAKEDSGKKVKRMLFSPLQKSHQFLFLFSDASQLDNKSGFLVTKNWCSWEIGAFYSETEEPSKYLIDLYQKKENSKTNNMLFDDFTILTGIDKGILI